VEQHAGMTTPTPGEHWQRDSTAPPALPDRPPVERGWQRSVDELLEQVAAERGIDFNPTPTVVAAALPGLVPVVEDLAAGMDTGDRRWLAAALAALSHAVGTMRLSPRCRRVRPVDAFQRPCRASSNDQTSSAGRATTRALSP
jgi:hypothetical protein